MADKHIYVDPDASGGGTGVDWANAYTSLQAAETANNADITVIGVYYFHCKSGSGSADGAAGFASWVTDATHYIVVQGGYAKDETGAPGTPEYPGKYSTDYYHVETTNNISTFRFAEDYCRADKILCQVTATGTSGARAFITESLTSGANDIRYSDCVAKGVCSGTGYGDGFRISDTDGIVMYSNCIAYGFKSTDNPADSGFVGFYIPGATVNVYNCLAYGNYNGFTGGSGTENIYNTVSFANTNDFNGTFSVISHCSSDDNDTTDASNVDGNEVDATWSTDFEDAANGDFTLLSGSPLVGAGDVDPSGSGYGSPSINGEIRGVAWDVGPWEYVAATTTLSPTTISPTTLSPTTVAPTTLSPTTIAPTTLPPTTIAPTTLAPTTVAPTTLSPTTIAPTTLSPTTIVPTTLAPTTLPPTTPAPTTIAPTTPVPTTLPPTTSPPPTKPPTTLAPTTLPPTEPPTTIFPTTLAPTTAPPVPVVLRRGISNFGFSFRDQWR